MRSYIKLFSDNDFKTFSGSRGEKVSALVRLKKSRTVDGVSFITGSGSAFPGLTGTNWFQSGSGGFLQNAIQAPDDPTIIEIPQGTWYFLQTGDPGNYLVLPFDSIVTQATPLEIIQRFFSLENYKDRPKD